MNIDQFITRARVILQPIISERGSVLYSATSTLQSGDFYTLGLNPGGDPSEIPETISECLDALPTYNGNAYMDEDWSGRRHYEKGCHPLQNNMKLLAQLLGPDLSTICSSNLVFMRSIDQYGSGYDELASRCWNVHRLILDIVRPKTLIVFGTGAISPYSFLLPKISGDQNSIKSGHGSWNCHSFTAVDEDRKFKVIALPHLSRYSLNGKTEVIGWIKQQIQHQ